jgi:hypothetical protein
MPGGKAGVTMPGKGRVVERGDVLDRYRNEVCYWADVPRPVRDTAIGRHQVVKKRLSHSECKLIGRGLTKLEARRVTSRRLVALVASGFARSANR